ncbi:MAG: hypothetical protein ACKV2U_00680 [Bryobacteraceae bacterium]
MAKLEDHWASVDPKAKAGHTRTIPMPGWVKTILDEWLQAANLNAGRLFRRVKPRTGKAWGDGLTEKFVSTPFGLVRFGMAINSGNLLQPATVELLQTSLS